MQRKLSQKITKCFIISFALISLSASGNVFAGTTANELTVPEVFVGESITIDEEPVVEFSDVITEENNYYEYTYTAPRDGSYGFKQQNLTPNTSMKSFIYDELGNEIGSLWCDGYTTKKLDGGKTYTIKVPRYLNNNCEYKITIYVQKDTTDITNITEIHDQINFKEQANIYTYTTTASGYYRFELNDTSANTKFNIYAWDSNGTNVLSKDYGSSGNTIYLEADETYQVEIRYFEDFGPYTLNVYRQKERKDVSGYQKISDSIEFKKQRNFYTFTPSIDGTYSFRLEDVNSANSFRLYVDNSNNENIYDSNWSWGEELDLVGNETYYITVLQENGRGNYNLSISYPNGALEKYEISPENQDASKETSADSENTDSSRVQELETENEELKKENEELKAQVEELQNQYDTLVSSLAKAGMATE